MLLPDHSRPPEGRPHAAFFPFEGEALAAYERLLSTSPQRTAFGHPGVVRAMAEAFGYEPRLVLVGAPEAPEGAMVLYERRRGPIRTTEIPALTPVVSPLFTRRLRGADVHRHRSPLDALLALLATRYDRAQLLLHPTISDVRPLLWAEWTVTPLYTYVVKLKSEKGRWTKTVRWAARPSAPAYTVEEGPDHLPAALALVAESHEREQFSMGASRRVIERLAEQLIASGHARVVVATPEGGAAPEAAVVIAQDGRTAHYWLAGNEPGPAMAMLFARLLPRLRSEGYTRVDLAGANVPSVAEFKRKLGGRLVRYDYAELVTKPPLRVLDWLRP